MTTPYHQARFWGGLIIASPLVGALAAATALVLTSDETLTLAAFLVGTFAVGLYGVYEFSTIEVPPHETVR